jgi:prevent-host-death family protein
MSRHSVAEAKNQLSRLIELALDGEEIVITRHGHPVVSLKPVAPPARRMSPADLDWLKAHRVKPRRPLKDAGALLSQMREEDNGRLS